MYIYHIWYICTINLIVYTIYMWYIPCTIAFGRLVVRDILTLFSIFLYSTCKYDWLTNYRKFSYELISAIKIELSNFVLK